MARDMLRSVWRGVRIGLNSAGEAAGDRRLGIQTRIRRGARPETDLDPYNGAYDPVPYRSLPMLDEAVPVSAQDVIYDIGCGMGRLVCHYATKSVSRAVGVEYDPRLAAIARVNAASLQGRRAPLEILEADAAEVDFRDATVAFMFNPFGPETMARVMSNLIRASTPALRIVYVNPVLESLVSRFAVKEISRFRVPYDLGYARVVVWSRQDAQT